MNRRNLLKTAGLAMAGSALFPFDSFAQSTNSESNLLENNNTSQRLSGKRKLGNTL